MLTPEMTFIALLVVQAAHLFHHRAAKRHISFVEVVSAAVLCIPPSQPWLAPAVLMAIHGALIVTQLVGSAQILRFSPAWERMG